MRLFSTVLVLLLAATANSSGQTKGPSLYFDSTEKDVGKVQQGETIRQVFSFTNKGTGTLEILDVGHSCDCETALLSAKKIPAGKEGQIEISIKTKSLSGAIKKQITLTTNDPAKPVIALLIRAEVEPEIALSEANIFFERVPVGKEARQEILLTVQKSKEIKILSVVSEDPQVTVKLEPVPGTNGKEVKLIALQKPIATPGYHEGKILVKTDSSLNPEISIYVMGAVVSASK